MNRKQRIDLIKSITTEGTEFETKDYGIQPVTKFTPHNCYLKPQGLPPVRYAWTSIHDSLKDKWLRYHDQNLQAKLELSFKR